MELSQVHRIRSSFKKKNQINMRTIHKALWTQDAYLLPGIFLKMGWQDSNCELFLLDRTWNLSWPNLNITPHKLTVTSRQQPAMKTDRKQKKANLFDQAHSSLGSTNLCWWPVIGWGEQFESISRSSDTKMIQIASCPTVTSLTGRRLPTAPRS